MKIRKGDKIKVIAGKDKGRTGVVEKAYQRSNKLIIPGVNLYKRHIKKNEKMPKGGIVDIPRPLGISKVMLVCPKCGKTTRVEYQLEKDKRFRVCKKCKSKI